MIAALRGEVIHIGLDHGVIDCAGVGYKFLATPKTLGTLRLSLIHISEPTRRS